MKAKVLESYPEPNPEDPDAGKYFIKYKNLVTIRFSGVQLLYQNCFQYGHAHVNCNRKGLKIKEYKSLLALKIDEIKNNKSGGESKRRGMDMMKERMDNKNCSESPTLEEDINNHGSITVCDG
ncbi:unnamed protein product [Lepeophtheirus salmonis]|uniref:(salmon louse) hypothetical protein n=1 Tax=Lepeophtheirus salmonis TaxID=72036 RepID=A0A7R8CX38_LEPSM|nr:unnamed protein product [Lepeophtheirus salmonis]CAF2957556.1 unnamed protein product [Lepeophtheirus salmonis]